MRKPSRAAKARLARIDRLDRPHNVDKGDRVSRKELSLDLDVNRKPTALAYKSWLFIGTLPYILGLTDLPPSLESGPKVFGVTAIWVLWLGALTSLVGLLWEPAVNRIRLIRRQPPHRVSRTATKLTSVVIEAMGLVGIGLGLFLYAIALGTAALTQSAALGRPYAQWSDTFLALCLCLAFSTASVFQIREHVRFRRAHLLPPEG